MEQTSYTRENLCGLVLGDYLIERRVGGGATSDVFLAQQQSLKRRVALKILKDELSNNQTYVKRFVQEARSAARLEHPNIVRIYEVGEFQTTPTRKRRFWRGKRAEQTKRYHFIAQEYIDGMSLSQYLRRHGASSIPQVFATLEQIALALKCAEDARLVHRDVKPENVLIDVSGAIKVVDFGLARPIGPNDATWCEASLTTAGVALGTPLYMSPEQARGQQLDSRSDLYSLGVTAYRMLTGTAPFQGETPLAVVLKHLNERPRDICEIRPDAPVALAKLVHRMIEKDPNKRPNSTADFLTELRQARQEYYASLDDQTTRELAQTPLDAETAGFELDSVACHETTGSGDSNPPACGSQFFTTPQERDVFNQAVHTTNVSRQWQANTTRLEAILRDGRARGHNRVATLCVIAAIAFAFGAIALLTKNFILASTNTEPPLTIERFNTVEEQYVFALQLGTIDAWKSVAEYFPNDVYWTSRAERQLALVYVKENDVDKAEELFVKMTTQPSPGSNLDVFGYAGLAWVAASRNDYDRAAVTVSELSNASRDHLTEYLLAKTRELIQRRFGEDSNLMRSFNRLEQSAPRRGENPPPRWNAPNGFGGSNGSNSPRANGSRP
ncbi:MAG: serine/threonine-protein kinase [Planctomycetia bacterium]|nr:serine/threonine-protein kinase [Planctomycetia bacterium]